MKKRKLVLALVGVACGCAVFGAVVFNSDAVRGAGWPLGVADLEGRWVLDHVDGVFENAPPMTLVFSAGSSADLVRVTADQREAEFAIQGLGRLVFTEVPHLEPLLSSGALDVHTMTHLCPPLPAWDHLAFFPDGPPLGKDPTRRSITYERD